MRNRIPIALVLCTIIGVTGWPGCDHGFDPDELGQLALVDQNGQEVIFPSDFEGNVAIVSFIYTSCPSICIQTTYRMQQVVEELGTIPDDIRIVSITLDPYRDRPDVLREFASVRNIDSSDWTFLTGSIDQIDTICDAVGIYVTKGFVEFDEEGNERYTIDHGDVVLLLDRNGQEAERYKGSELDPKRVARKALSLRSGEA